MLGRKQGTGGLGGPPIRPTGVLQSGTTAGLEPAANDDITTAGEAVALEEDASHGLPSIFDTHPYGETVTHTERELLSQQSGQVPMQMDWKSSFSNVLTAQSWIHSAHHSNEEVFRVRPRTEPPSVVKPSELWAISCGSSQNKPDDIPWLPPLSSVKPLFAHYENHYMTMKSGSMNTAEEFRNVRAQYLKELRNRVLSAVRFISPELWWHIPSASLLMGYEEGRLPSPVGMAQGDLQIIPKAIANGLWLGNSEEGSKTLMEVNSALVTLMGWLSDHGKGWHKVASITDAWRLGVSQTDKTKCLDRSLLADRDVDMPWNSKGSHASGSSRRPLGDPAVNAEAATRASHCQASIGVAIACKRGHVQWRELDELTTSWEFYSQLTSQLHGLNALNLMRTISRGNRPGFMYIPYSEKVMKSLNPSLPTRLCREPAKETDPIEERVLALLSVKGAEWPCRHLSPMDGIALWKYQFYHPNLEVMDLLESCNTTAQLSDEEVLTVLKKMSGPEIEIMGFIVLSLETRLREIAVQQAPCLSLEKLPGQAVVNGAELVEDLDGELDEVNRNHLKRGREQLDTNIVDGGVVKRSRS